MLYSPKDLISTSKAAQICSVSRVTIHNWIKSGKLKALKLPGGQLKILRQNLDAFIHHHFQVLNSPDPAGVEMAHLRVSLISEDTDILGLFQSPFKPLLEVKPFASVMLAVSELDHFMPDYLVIDHTLTGALDLAHFIHSCPKYKKITPLLVVSGDGPHPPKIPHFLRGNVLARPFTIEDIQQKLGARGKIFNS